MPPARQPTGPGRVNLIGDHTDYNDGLALPMAIDLQTTASFTESDSGRILLSTSLDPRPAELPVDIPFDPSQLSAISPSWASLAAAVASQARPPSGGVVTIASSLPMGAGLSSSAAFSVSLAMVFGVEGPPSVFAHLCQRAERAVGLDVGLMDPLVIAGASAGHAMLFALACQVLADADLGRLAGQAAVSAWSSRSQLGSLCCGQGGIGYALLAMHRLTGEDRWLQRARAAARRAAADRSKHFPDDALYKGALGVALLLDDLKAPQRSAMPLFEPVCL